MKFRAFAISVAMLGLSLSGRTAEPLYFGVSGPLTGPDAQYGDQWKKGFDLALTGINEHGGIRGRQLHYIFEDSQSDPRQAVAVAQKFVNDPRVVIGRLMEQYGTDRRSIEDGLGRIKNVPSLLYGRLSFNPQTRRAEGAHHIPLVVKAGAFALWDGKPVSAGQR